VVTEVLDDLPSFERLVLAWAQAFWARNLKSAKSLAEVLDTYAAVQAT